MGKPPVDKTKDGRANLRGISYLYLASDADTATAEIHPLMLDKIWMGEFIARAPLGVVDLRNPMIGSPFPLGDRLGFIIMYIGFLRKLGLELSKAVSPKSAELDYVPLQYLREFIKKSGYDGVIYGSSVADGYNLAVFADQGLECVKTELYQVEIVKYMTKKLQE